MIPLGVRNTPPMLATTAPGETPEAALAPLTRQDKWSYEIKFDGIRCLATVEDGAGRLVSRSGIDLSRKHPAVVAALEKAFPKTDVLLDGELICLDEQGTMTFAQVTRRGSQAAFMAFDVLFSGKVDRRTSPYAVRMVILDGLAEQMVEYGAGRLFRAVRSSDGDAMWATALKHGMEGIVAKSVTSTYTPGKRSPSWLKIKAKHRVSALVTDLQPGEGSRSNTFGALVVSLHQDGDWTEVGRVGSGFSDHDLAEVVAAITTEQPVIVEVEYLTFTEDGRLREPVFKGIRTDMKAVECTIDQIREGSHHG